MRRASPKSLTTVLTPSAPPCPDPQRSFSLRQWPHATQGGPTRGLFRWLRSRSTQARGPGRRGAPAQRVHRPARSHGAGSSGSQSIPTAPQQLQQKARGTPGPSSAEGCAHAGHLAGARLLGSVSPGDRHLTQGRQRAGILTGGAHADVLSHTLSSCNGEGQHRQKADSACSQPPRTSGRDARRSRARVERAAAWRASPRPFLPPVQGNTDDGMSCAN